MCSSAAHPCCPTISIATAMSTRRKATKREQGSSTTRRTSKTHDRVTDSLVKDGISRSLARYIFLTFVFVVVQDSSFESSGF